MERFNSRHRLRLTLMAFGGGIIGTAVLLFGIMADLRPGPTLLLSAMLVAGVGFVVRASSDSQLEWSLSSGIRYAKSTRGRYLIAGMGGFLLLVGAISLLMAILGPGTVDTAVFAGLLVVMGGVFLVFSMKGRPDS